MNLFSSPTGIFWTAILLIVVVPTIAYYWNKTRKEAIEADLKMKMLEMGMSASDIERVLNAENQNK